MMYSDLDMTILAVLLESKVEKRIEIIQPKAWKSESFYCYSLSVFLLTSSPSSSHEQIYM